MEISQPLFHANEISKSEDMNYLSDSIPESLSSILDSIVGKEITSDMVISGLTISQANPLSMNVALSSGLAFNKYDNTLVFLDSPISNIPIQDADTLDRIDTLEIRLSFEEYDVKQRAFKDPDLGSITYVDVPVKKKATVEYNVKKGTPGSGTAPTKTDGWVKIAEITVPASATQIIDTNIKNVNADIPSESNSGWTNDQQATFLLKGLTANKTTFRVNHTSTGDHNSDSIKDYHIDWGTGTNQVSASDVPIADSLGKYTIKNVEGALAQIVGLENAPVGTILMFDANNPGGGSGGSSGAWQDNVTIPGWYACIPENAQYGCPNLVDRFIMGKVVSGTGATGGANNYSLSTAQLPVHSHTVDHGHTASSGTQSANHTHSVSGTTGSGGSHNHVSGVPYSTGEDAYAIWGNYYIGVPKTRRSGGDNATYSPYTSTVGDHTHSFSATSGSNSANHTHTITVNSHSGSSGNTGSGSSVDNRPAYYSVIFIRKCFA